ncbi:MAG: hypothetical protein AAF437_04000 [Pseudomonadota bacterium]
MLRHSTAPLALCVFLLAGCNVASEDAAIAPETVVPEAETPPAESTEYTLTITSPPVDGTKASTTTASAKPRTLAVLPENQQWTLIARSPDRRGNFLTLRLTDTGNGDSEAFSYDDETGELTLVAPVDFERPIDADADNKFELLMELSDIPGKPQIPFALDVTDQKEIFEDYPVVWVRGETAFGGLGRHITPLGDIDVDGRPDLALGAPGRHNRDDYLTLPPTGYAATGDAYFVSGETLSTTTLLDLGDDAGAGIWRLSGAAEDLNVGYNMTMLGDLDEDGIDDFLIARDEQSLEVVSGATLVTQMTSGGDSLFDDVTTGSITLASSQFIDPRTFANLGDLDGDGLDDLAFCGHGTPTGNYIEAQLFTVSGAALAGVLTNGGTQTIGTLFASQQAAYYAYSGNHLNCGPLIALGDVNEDDLTDVGIPMPGPGAGDSGLLIFDGAELLTMMQAGGRHRVTPFDRFFFGKVEPYVHFTDDAAHGTMQDFMATALGDVSGDGIDDFGFSWAGYHSVDDSAYVVKGHAGLLDNLGGSQNIRALVPGGGAIHLAATPDGFTANDNRIEPVFALRALEEGLHSTLLFVGAGPTSNSFFSLYSLFAGDLPTGGTSMVPLPIAAVGDLSIPKGNRRLLSNMVEVGDLNRDGYSDLAIGWDIADYRNQDVGTVLLVSGKEIVEARARGEMLRPSSRFAPQ